MKFNEKLMELRKKKGLSQEELGEKINVARQTISKWELAETTPEMDKLIKLSEIFEISLDELVKNVSEEKQQVSNTQKLAGIVIIILKIVAGLIIVGLILSIIGIFLFSTNFTTKTSLTKEEIQIIEKNERIEE